MPMYLYNCSGCGEFESLERADFLDHDCGLPARRVWRLRIAAETARHRGRWDAQVGAYVSNEGQFQSLLRQGQERESAELGMDVKLETVDARDQEALAELHRQPLEERKEIIAQSDFADRAKRAK
jgi:hypothetical protein